MPLPIIPWSQWWSYIFRNYRADLRFYKWHDSLDLEVCQYRWVLLLNSNFRALVSLLGWCWWAALLQGDWKIFKLWWLCRLFVRIILVMIAIWSELTVSLKINWKDSIVASTWNINEINSFFLLLMKSYRMLLELLCKSPKHFLAICRRRVDVSIKCRFYRVHSIDKGHLTVLTHTDFDIFHLFLALANGYCLGIINIAFKRFLLFLFLSLFFLYLLLQLSFLVNCLESLRLYAMFDIGAIGLGWHGISMFEAFRAQYWHRFSLNYCLVVGCHALRSKKLCRVFLIHWQ